MKDTNRTLKTRRPLDKTISPAFMYHQLRLHDPVAVRLLCEGIKSHLQFGKIGKTTSVEDIEELTNDAAVLVLRKISDGTFSFLGVNPVCYAKTVADNLLRNFRRKKQMICQAFNEEIEPFQMPEVEAYFAQKELKNQVENALSKLSEANQLVIRLKYFEGLKDEEIVRDGLSPHRSTYSLKSARCRSLKRLAGLMVM